MMVLHLKTHYSAKISTLKKEPKSLNIVPANNSHPKVGDCGLAKACQFNLSKVQYKALYGETCSLLVNLYSIHISAVVYMQASCLLAVVKSVFVFMCRILTSA